MRFQCSSRRRQYATLWVPRNCAIGGGYEGALSSVSRYHTSVFYETLIHRHVHKNNVLNGWNSGKSTIALFGVHVCVCERERERDETSFNPLALQMDI